MNITQATSSIFLVLTIAVSSTGCLRSGDMMGPTPTTSIRIAPEEGSENVNTATAIVLNFPRPADRIVVERSLHLVSEQDMADSNCPISNSMGHGMMNAAMMDSMKMKHVIDHHRTSGTFRWNNNNMECTFTPDSLLHSSMRYMVHMGSEMMNMMNGQMDHMGMMGSHNNSMMSQDRFVHFRTHD